MTMIFTEKIIIVFAYTSRPSSEELVMQPAVLYILYTASSHEKIGNNITFARFEEGGLL